MCTAMPPTSSPQSSHLARVDAGPDREPEVTYSAGDPLRAPDRARGSVERREDPVSRQLDEAAPEPCDLRPHLGVVSVEQRAPLAVAELGGPPGGIDDVGEQDRGQRAASFHRRALTERSRSSER